MTCECNNTFFVEHKNAIIFYEPKRYFHVFHKQIDLGYSIYECMKCRKLYICRKHYSGRIDKLIAVNEFNEDDASTIIARNRILDNLNHFTDSFISNMIQKEVGYE